MLGLRVHSGRASVALRCALPLFLGLVVSAAALLAQDLPVQDDPPASATGQDDSPASGATPDAPPASGPAQDTPPAQTPAKENPPTPERLGPVTVGAGLRTGYYHSAPTGSAGTDQFQLNDIRLYVNGNITKYIKFMFNTEYDGVTNKVGVLDAVARIEVSPEFNIWAGRFLPPSDRANLYGPFFAHEWNVYTDGIQDGYPFVFQGRDNGVVYWGTFAKKVKVSAGVFDGGSVDGNPKVIGAARVQIDFWDPEDGYYLNGTYYGDKNLLAIGGATQYQDGHTASTIDFLLEKKVPGGGAFTIESEYANYNRLGGYDSRYFKSQGVYGTASFLFPKKVGVGQFEILGKYAKAEFTHGAPPSYDQKTTEFNLNYVIKQFNLRVMSFGQDVKFNREKTDFWQAGIGLQIQM